MSGVQFGNQIDMNGLKVTEMGDGTALTDAVNLSQLNDIAPEGFAQTIGDGVALSFPVVHNFGTLDVMTSVVSVSSGDYIATAASVTDVNTVTVTFPIPPAVNAYRVLIVPVP